MGLDLGQRTNLQQRRPLWSFRTEGALKKLRAPPRQLRYSAVKTCAECDKHMLSFTSRLFSRFDRCEKTSLLQPAKP